jgi:excisionase family DNA binding protein
MTTLWTCPKPDCGPTRCAPLEEADLAPFLTTSDVAELFGVSMNKVYKWIQTGKAPPYYRVGSSIYFRASDVLVHDGAGRSLCQRVWADLPARRIQAGRFSSARRRSAALIHF